MDAMVGQTLGHYRIAEKILDFDPGSDPRFQDLLSRIGFPGRGSQSEEVKK